MKFPILMYHRITTDPTSKYDVALSDFEAQMAIIDELEFTAESISCMLERLENNRPFPERYVVLTFDDGNDSDLAAARVLQQHGFTGTFCVVTDWLGTPGHLSREQVVALAECHHVGSHSVTHGPLSQLSEDKLRYELHESKKLLEVLLGQACDTLCVPGGAVSQAVHSMAQDTGYDLVGTSNPTFATTDQVRNHQCVNRICVTRDMSLNHFRNVLRGKATAVVGEWARFQLICLTRRLLPTATFKRVRQLVSQH